RTTVPTRPVTPTVIRIAGECLRTFMRPIEAFSLRFISGNLSLCFHTKIYGCNLRLGHALDPVRPLRIWVDLLQGFALLKIIRGNHRTLRERACLGVGTRGLPLMSGTAASSTASRSITSNLWYTLSSMILSSRLLADLNGTGQDQHVTLRDATDVEGVDLITGPPPLV